jgi:O-antigen biosynthesis protein
MELAANAARIAETDTPRSPAANGEASVSVVICAYDDARWDHTVAAIAAIGRQSKPALETILVVDHNRGLIERARRELPGILVLANTGVRGLADARNSGITAARGSVIAFLDDDALPDREWLERMVAAYSDRSVAGVAGLVEPLWTEGRPEWFPPEFDWVVGCSYRGLPTGRAAVRNPIGANMSFRSDLFERAGRFRAGMGRIGRWPVGCEETEFSIRAAQAVPGTRVVTEPGARVRHRVPSERAKFSYFASRCLAEGLSKALVSRHVGRSDGLASERAYVMRALPAGIGRALAQAVRGEPGKALRAGAIVAGLALTGVGYLAGTLRGRREADAPQVAPAPAQGTSEDSRVTVVIATRSRPAELRHCLRSLLAQTHPPERVVVVDDEPAEGTAGFVAGCDAPPGLVRYLPGEGRGLAAAHNTGLSLVETPLVAFTDDDVVVDPRWLERIVAAFDAVDRVGCVTGKIVAHELETQEQVWLDGYAGFDKGTDRRVFDLADHRPEHALFPFAAGMLGSGANMAFSAAALRDMGGFDPALGAGTLARGGDDLAAFLEVLLLGYRLVYEPEAVVRHRHARDYPALRRQVYGYGVGLTAYLTKSFLHRPRLLAPAARLLPRATAYALKPESPRNARRPRDYPPVLSRLELLGMLAGPWAYARSRRRARQAGEVVAS